MALYLVFPSSWEFYACSLVLFSINNSSFVCSSLLENIGQMVLLSVEENLELLMRLTAYKDSGLHWVGENSLEDIEQNTV